MRRTNITELTPVCWWTLAAGWSRQVLFVILAVASKAARHWQRSPGWLLVLQVLETWCSFPPSSPLLPPSDPPPATRLSGTGSPCLLPETRQKRASTAPGYDRGSQKGETRPGLEPNAATGPWAVVDEAPPTCILQPGAIITDACVDVVLPYVHACACVCARVCMSVCVLIA